MTALFSSVVLQWWMRRILELGPLVSGALSWFLNQPPEVQQTLLAILEGNWATVTLGTIVHACEVVITELEGGTLSRDFDPGTGLPLWRDTSLLIEP